MMGDGMAGAPEQRARRSRHAGGDVLCLVLLLAGCAALFQVVSQSGPRVAASDLRTWRAVTADGTPLEPAPGRTAGLRLPEGASLRLIEEDDALNRFHEVDFELRPESDPCRVDLRLRWAERRGYLVRLQLRPTVTATLWWIGGGDGSTSRLPSGRPGDATAPPAGGSHRVTADFRDGGLVVAVDGLELASLARAEPEDGWVELSAARGGLDVLGFEVRGRKTAQAGAMEPFVVHGSMDAATPPSRRAAALGRAAGLMAALWMAATLFVRAVASLAPGFATSLAAGARLLAPGCAMLLMAVVLRLPSSLVIASSVAPLGMFAAWRRLDTAGCAPLPGGGRRTVEALLLIPLLCGGTAWLVARHEVAVLEEAATHEAAARRGAAPAAFRADEPLALRADNALVVPGPWTDARLTAAVTVHAGSALAVRLRARDASIAEGLLAVLPADPRLRSALYHEDPVDFLALGATAPPLPPDREVAVEIVMRGREYAVRVDGEPLLEAVSLRPVAGDIVLLAHHGRATLGAVAVDPLPPAPHGSAASDAAASALTPLAVLLAFALVASRLLRWGATRALHAAAFALLPLAGLLLLRPAGEPLPAASVRAVALAGGVVLALVPLTRLRVRPAGACLLAIGGFVALPHVVTSSIHAVSFVSADLMNRLSYLDWPGETLHEDLLHLEHPLFRRWNHYLARHRFRGQDVELEKPRGVTRVVALGGSGTWGWRLPAGSREDWPATLERLLDRPVAAEDGAAPARWEVVNAAYIAATSGRLFRFLRNVLVDYEPDVVVLSVCYNDAAALSQGDEDAYLARVKAPGARRGWWHDWLERRRRAQERASLEGFLRAGMRRTDAAAVWRATGIDGWPPDRFAASLRRYAELARERGIRLVLVKEPIAGDGPYLWKEEFHAAMDAVGAEYGVPVVDPSPALQAAGGRQRFIDDVHLKPSGHRILAEVLEPVVRAQAAARTEGGSGR
jgi:lysophospholipase L1-like esterase